MMLFEIKKKKDKIQSHRKAGVIKDHKWIGLNNRNLSKFWRLEAPNQGFSRADSFWGPRGNLTHVSLLASGGLLAIFGFCCIIPSSAFSLP